MKHKALAYTFIIAVFAATVSMLYYYEVKKGIPEYQQTLVHKTPDDNFRTYSNGEHGFQMTYPRNWQFQAAGEESPIAQYFAKDGVPVAMVSLPRDYYVNSNFGGGAVYLAVRKNATVSQCRTYTTGPLDLEMMEQKITLGKNIFYAAKMDGAALGTYYNSEIYRIHSGDTCYEASFTSSVSNIENYDPILQKKAVSQTEINDELRDVIATFKLTN